MKDTIEIKSEKERDRVPEKKSKRKINKWGIYASIILIAAGIIWYAINFGLIPLEFIKEMAGPIVIIILGILILIKSL